MPASKSVKLNTGAEMPTLGLGTWKSEPGTVEKAVEVALKAGYKLIDTATNYGNEREVGLGIKASGVPRESFFLTTKLACSDHRRVAEALEFSLTQLGTSYLDLWLMHWPAPMQPDYSGADFEHNWLDTWREMEKIYKANPDKIKAIGVSNVYKGYLEQLLEIATVVPAVDQVELHPSLVQEEIVQFCREKGIAVTGYSPLGSNDSPLPSNPTVNAIAKKYNVSPANVLISLQANRPNVTVLAKSVTPQRIVENLKIIDLTEEDIKELHAIENTHSFRVCTPSWTGWTNGLGFPQSTRLNVA